MKKNQNFFALFIVISSLYNHVSAQAPIWYQSGNNVVATNSGANVGIGTTPGNARLFFANLPEQKIALSEKVNPAYGVGYWGFGLSDDFNMFASIPDEPGQRFSLRLNDKSGPEKFMVTRDGNVGLGGIYPTKARLEFDNAIGNKIRFFSSGSSNYGMAVNPNNLAAYIPNLAGHRFSIRLGDYNGYEVFTVANDGKVTAGSRLYLGATGVEGAGYSLLHFKNVTSATAGIVRSSLGNTDAGNAPLMLESSVLSVNSGGQTRLYVNGAGNVGIGTTNPTYKLAVNGTIRAKEIRVETGWADYVFAPDYTLRPLSEVESYIQENKHLPDVTSAADIQKDGLQVGEQMTQMMRKIEELTLYIIDLKKENTALQTRLEKLEKQ